MDIDALMDLARRTAPSSPNRVRQVGAAIMPADGRGPIAACNTFPSGVRDLDWRHEGDGRFVWMEHAERNAIFEAARTGRALQGAVMATNFFPCIDCARAIVQSGVATLASPEPALDDPVWGASFPRSRAILEEGGIKLAFLKDDPRAVQAAFPPLAKAASRAARSSLTIAIMAAVMLATLAPSSALIIVMSWDGNTCQVTP